MKKFIGCSILLVISLLTFNCSKNYDALYLEAMDLKNQGKYTEAREVFEKAAVKKETPEVYKEIANFYIEYSKDYNKAEDYLQKSLKLNPNYPNSIHNMGLVYLKKYEKSVENNEINNEYLKTSEQWFTKNINLNPDFGLSYAEYGMVLFYNKKNNDAVLKIKTGIEKGANKSYAHLLLGKIYFNGYQDYNLALENFNIAYNDFGKDPFLLKMMALTNKKLNHINDARTYYHKYIKSLEDSGLPEEMIKKAREDESKLISG
ncbi:MAG: tetratricopeptide repeat protein [Spirochaetia bacterium]|nr:tetratricopeptide repeat protein [Spirochaetia bacterium]